MRKIFSIVCLVLIVSMAFAACGGKEKQPEVRDFDEAVNTRVVTIPPAPSVVMGNKKLIISAYDVSWAYAINDKEWCSVKTTEFIEPLDQDYRDWFVLSDSTGKKLTISFPAVYAPDEIAFIHYYPIDLWMPGENDEDLRIKEKIERQRDYEAYEELIIRKEIAEDHYRVIIDTSELKSGVYDIEMAWDRPEYRGTGKYSFLIREDGED